MASAETQPSDTTPVPEAPAANRLRTYTVRTLLVRLLAYVLPYKWRLILAFSIGILAGALNALNLVALLPALQLILDPKVQVERFDKLEKEIATLEAKTWETQDWTAWIEQTQRDIDLFRVRTDQALTYQLLKENAIFWLVGIVCAMQIVKAFLDFLSKYLLSRSFLLAVNRVRNDLYAKCLALDLAHFQSSTSGDLLGRLNNDIRKLRDIFGAFVGSGILVPFNLFFLFLILILLNPRLTLITVIAVPLIVVPMGLLGRKLRTMGKADEAEDVKLLDVINETIVGLSVVKAYGAEKYETKRFQRKSLEVTKRQARREMLRLLGEPATETIGTIAFGAVISVGAYFILFSNNAYMSPEAFILYLVVLSRFYPPLKSLSTNFVKAQKGFASAERVFEVMDSEPRITDPPNAIAAPPIARDLEFRSVSFRYPGRERLVLDGVSFRVPKGARVALVGASGSGKTTAIRLISRFYDFESGAILLDGTDIRELTLASLRGQMALVTQDTFLFNDTVSYNIQYGRTTATHEEVVAAAKAANAHDFIMALPNGYDTVLGERGGQLSGGQRQRIAIARALLRNAPILLLDEATSALDTESEALVTAALERLMEDRTTIVIAHRLSTIRDADTIVVFDQGRVVEIGTHDELLAKNGRYSELARLGTLSGDHGA